MLAPYRHFNILKSRHFCHDLLLSAGEAFRLDFVGALVSVDGLLKQALGSWPHTQSMHARLRQSLCYIDGIHMKNIMCMWLQASAHAREKSCQPTSFMRSARFWVTCDANNEWANESISYHLDSLSRFHTCRLYRRPSGRSASLLGWWPCVAGCRSGQSTKIIMKLLKHKRCW